MEADQSQVNDGIYMTEEQYLVLDEATDGKYEFYNGYVIMLRPPSSAYDDQPNQTVLDMAAGNVPHAALVARLAWMLGSVLHESTYTVYSNVWVRPAECHYFYADLAVCAGQPAGVMLTRPVVVIEVLSPLTEERDRGVKLDTYLTLSTIQEYVLVGSTKKAIEVHRRKGSSLKQNLYQEGDLVELNSIGVSFPFEAVYRGIEL